MRQLIGMRQAADSPFRRRTTPLNSPQKHKPATPSGSSNSRIQEFTESIETLLGQSDRELKRAITSQDTLQVDLQQLTSDLKIKSSEIITLKTELQNAKRQCEVVKDLLADTTAENDILHQVYKLLFLMSDVFLTYV